MDRISPARRSENMRRIRSRDTSPELTVRRLVHRMGFRYRLSPPHLPGKPDMAFARLRKVIFVHGCFWHSHRGCKLAHAPRSRLEYWGPKLKRNKARDRQSLRALRALGWEALVVWECETANPLPLAARLLEFLRS
jgi:DNA mismatch endonuclease (patch repair protein)